ncbi:hypothetical protein HanPSC8_Chr02g0082891 [Helianthus annuus]|nr:hypothetical protein HanPSC8_Chr02g0082891 [Helianthus annuus]
MRLKRDVPMHIDTTPNRQSLPRRFISCSRVATQRAPVINQVQYYNKNKYLKNN